MDNNLPDTNTETKNHDDITITDSGENNTDYVYDDVFEWVDDWLLQTVRRRIAGNLHWCNKWYKHPEAYDRIKCLWKAWEATRYGDEDEASTWWIQHFDNQWIQLTSNEGAMQFCTPDNHKEVTEALQTIYSDN